MTRTYLSPSSFGSVMPTRVWSDASREYRYGFNGKEKENETSVDDYDFGARIYDGRLGRWLSLDPLQLRYSNISPYNGFANSPNFIKDFEGMKIWIYYEEMIGDKVVIKKVQYKKGKLYNEDGKRIDMKNFKDPYVLAVKADLDKLRSTDKIFKTDIDNLSRSKHNHSIKHYSMKKGSAKDVKGNATESETNDETSGKPQGSIIYYDPNNNTAPNKEERPAVIGLTHELGHALQFNFGTYNKHFFAKDKDGKSTSIYSIEEEAVAYENIMRAYLLKDMRTSYDKVELDPINLNKDLYDRIIAKKTNELIEEYQNTFIEISQKLKIK